MAAISAVGGRPYPVVLTAVEVPGILAVAAISVVDAVPILWTFRLLLVFPTFLASPLLPIYQQFATLLLLAPLMFQFLLVLL